MGDEAYALQQILHGTDPLSRSRPPGADLEPFDRQRASTRVAGGHQPHRQAGGAMTAVPRSATVPRLVAQRLRRFRWCAL
jgi:hypothetical protein